MPEMTFTVRWPDGGIEECYSPSLVIHDHLVPGVDYPVEDFVRRCTEALGKAADRVRATYGFVCTSAMAQQAQITTRSAAFGLDEPVRVLRMVPGLPAEADR